jgi:hypothetical protein
MTTEIIGLVVAVCLALITFGTLVARAVGKLLGETSALRMEMVALRGELQLARRDAKDVARDMVDEHAKGCRNYRARVYLAERSRGNAEGNAGEG